MPSQRLAIPALLLALSPALAQAQESPAPEAGPVLKLATYNIHHAEGRDGRLDLKRVADAVRGSDVVALQEVDVRFRDRSGGEDQVARLAEELGMHAAFGANLVEGEGQYGVALLSRFPIASHRNHRLPHDGPARAKAEPRGVLESHVRLPDGRTLRVFVTHLSHDSAPERRVQVDRLRELIGLEAADAPTGPWVLMGDLNFRPDSPEYARLLGDEPRRVVDAWPSAGRGAGPTIGLDGPHPARIDYVLVSPDLAPGLLRARVDAEVDGSDHQPVFVELRLPAAPAAGREPAR
jgi:endonuclease/exonuclease/phosphatase family metal-dependent hydrolase